MCGIHHRTRNWTARLLSEITPLQWTSRFEIEVEWSRNLPVSRVADEQPLDDVLQVRRKTLAATVEQLLRIRCSERSVGAHAGKCGSRVLVLKRSSLRYCICTGAHLAGSIRLCVGRARTF